MVVVVVNGEEVLSVARQQTHTPVREKHKRAADDDHVCLFWTEAARRTPKPKRSCAISCVQCLKYVENANRGGRAGGGGGSGGVHRCMSRSRRRRFFTRYHSTLTTLAVARASPDRGGFLSFSLTLREGGGVPAILFCFAGGHS